MKGKALKNALEKARIKGETAGIRKGQLLAFQESRAKVCTFFFLFWLADIHKETKELFDFFDTKIKECKA